MSITFHCEHCNRKIEAPDSAGGKWGKCPSCHNKVYVPNLQAGEEEELKLAPIDKKEETRRQKLMAETYKLTQDLLGEREIPDDKAEGGTGAAGHAVSDINDRELTKNIILYLRLMADGDLDEANRAAEGIIPFGGRAVKIIDKIALSEIPEPELADIPQQVLSGLIRSLRARIASGTSE